MQMPSRIGVCGAGDTAAAAEAVAVARAVTVTWRAAVAVAAVLVVVLVVVAVTSAVDAPAPARTMLAVSAAEPAKSDRIPIATSAPLRISRMASAEESQNYRRLAISAHPAKLCAHDIESIRVAR